ncbi:hypothetical protein [Pseudomonas sp. zfem005]|uniref:hypothetical protein n=1 Tax=Pseudomonas sp. zfem005 TaxID=3078200 RepID=UPI0029286754|nr:hypothetical protein [Pseudomonas sp. zfem005]MDU9415191.1 hypothetical protein [Pseudomonas sp. zfem005]
MKLSNNMLNNINGLMTGGGCPTSDHLGECAVIFEGSPGRYQAMLYIFDGAFNNSTQVADWFHDLGAVDVSVSQTLHSDVNGDRNGKTVDGGQEWTVGFTLKGENPHADEPEKYAEVLLPFLKLMETELHANAGKGDRPGWLAMDRKTALLEIFYHLSKLQKALKVGNNDGIREHAADTANMCMMLVDICGLLTASDPTAAEQQQAGEAILPEERTVNIPGCDQHEGLYSLRVTMPWVCMHCGKPRGEPYDNISYDGSRRLKVHRWNNPCGHLETYAEVRATLTGLPLGRPSEAEEAQP